jgi:ELWxxDGT repeat protein
LQNSFNAPCALLGGDVAFFADFTSLYRTTGVGGSTVSVSTGLTPLGGPTCLGDRAFFFARNASNIIGPYIIDDTASAPTPLTGTIPLAYDYATFAAGTVMYFSANFTPAVGRELYKLDGNTITLVSDLAPGVSTSGATSFGRMKGRLLFSAASNGFDFEPWALAIDPTPPVITPVITGTLGTNGWYTSNVSLSFTVTEPDSRLVTHGCQAQSVTVDTAGVTFHCFALSEGDQADVVVTIKRDTVLPAAPLVTAPVAGSSVGNHPTVGGTAAEAGTIEVRQGATLLCSVVVTVAGPFSCQSTVALVDGPVTLTVTELDDAGNRSPAATTSITVDTVAPPAPALTSPPEGGSVSTRAFSGTGEAGSTVSVFADGSPTAVCTALVDASGNWTCTPAIALADGAHTVAASAKDPAGNTSPSTGRTFTLDTVAPAAPSISSPTSGQLLSTAMPRVAGRGEVGASVTVTFDQNASVTCTAVVDANGDWACTPTSALATGAHAAAALAVDAAGNVSPSSPTVTFSLDASTPAAPVLSAPADGALLATTRPTFIGTAVAGQLIRVLVDGSMTPVCTAAVSPGGGWQCAPSVSLSQGLHSAVAIASNSVGTDSSPSNSVGFTVDSQAPSAPLITRPVSGSTVSLRPLFEGTAEASAVVQVLLDGQSTPTCTATATTMGAFSCSSVADLSEGTHSVQAVAVDAAGNTSAASGTVVFNVSASIDTRAPEVTCPPDLSVEASRGGSASVNFTATVTDNTDLTPSLHYSQAPGSDFLEGETVVTVTATDASMNSASCSFRVTVTPSTQTGMVSHGCGCGAGPDALLLIGALFLAARRRRQGR